MVNAENGKYMEWDFANPEHEAYLLDCFDGKENMQKEYPVLYGMLLHTKNMAQNDVKALKSLKTGGAAGYVDRAHIHELVIKNNTAADNVTGKYLYSKGCITLVSVKSAVHIVLEIFKNGERIGRNFRTETNVQSLELDCSVENISVPEKKDSVYAAVSCFWNEPDSDILCGGYIKDTLNLESGNYIANTACENPGKKVSTAPEAILVSYGRGSAKNVDYWYPEGQRDKNGNQMVRLEVNGQVKLSDSVFKEYKAHDMSMFSASKGVILYKGAAPVCTQTQDGFTWSYDSDWKDSIQSSVKYGQHLYEFDMRLEFVVTAKDGKDYEQYIDVSSLNTEDAGNVVIIKPIQLLWGCLAKDTPVCMADGSEKKISDICIGDRVAAKDGSSVVSNVWTGMEEEIYHIRTDNGSEIYATGEHQFKTDTGYVRVLDLTSDTRLLSDEGSIMRAVYCYAEPYNDKVYSLDLESGDSFYAAGFVSGTMERQNMACSKEILPSVREELRLELDKMAAQIAEGVIFKADRLHKRPQE